MIKQSMFAQISRAMNRSAIWTALCAGALLCAASAVPTAFSQTRSVPAPTAKPVISLVNETPLAASMTAPVKGEASFANAPANFHAFASAHVGENTTPERLTLRFAASTMLTQIKSTKDFQVEQGSTCIEGGYYSAGESCTLLVRFTPQGPGRRLGKLTISNTASATPFALGLGGSGFAPVISFTPAVISTVSGSAGLLKSAQNLTIDGGDTLYMADTGNGDIRYMDSSGTINNAVTGVTTPEGIAVDNFGNIFFDDGAATGHMYEIYNYATFYVGASGTGTDTCTVSTPCQMVNEQLYYPGMMSIDHNNNLIFANEGNGAAFSALQPTPPTYFNLYSPFAYQEATLPDGFAADYNDNIYSLWSITTICEIQQQSLFNAEESSVAFTKVAGGRNCGFSGDGGQAANAEIGSLVGQMFFDEAGDMYFSDTNNQRVREINAATGLINTIAGNGTAGDTGDGGAGTSSELSYPTGVAVDSQGQVYIISGTGTTKGGAESIRKLGPNGILSFGSQAKGTASAAHMVTVSNTGNSTLTLTNAVFTGANAGAFKVDPNTTSCVLTAGAVLYAGQTCKVGIIFTPAVAGSATASFVMLDNTVTNSNTVQLTGTGTLPAPTFKITSPANGASFTSGTAVTFSASVTGSPQPTGTVQFKVDGTNHGTPVTLSSGTASTSLTGLSTASHTLGATYSGDSNWASATATSISITIKAAATVKFTAPSTTQSQKSTSPIVLKVTVTADTASAPTGKVSFSVDGKALATSAIVSGKATANAGMLAVGSHTLTAAYSGDQHHSASKTTEKITVSAAASAAN